MYIYTYEQKRAETQEVYVLETGTSAVFERSQNSSTRVTPEHGKHFRQSCKYIRGCGGAWAEVVRKFCSREIKVQGERL